VIITAAKLDGDDDGNVPYVKNKLRVKYICTCDLTNVYTPLSGPRLEHAPREASNVERQRRGNGRARRFWSRR